MKCPRSTQHFRHSKDGDRWEFADCLKEECAWWGEGWKMCSITALFSDIGFIAGVLQDIEMKMPVAKE